MCGITVKERQRGSLGDSASGRRERRRRDNKEGEEEEGGEGASGGRASKPVSARDVEGRRERGGGREGGGMFLPLLPLQPVLLSVGCCLPGKQEGARCNRAAERQRDAERDRAERRFCFEGDCWTGCEEALDTDLRIHGLPAVRERATSIPLSHSSYSAKG